MVKFEQRLIEVYLKPVTQTTDKMTKTLPNFVKITFEYSHLIARLVRFGSHHNFLLCSSCITQGTKEFRFWLIRLSSSVKTATKNVMTNINVMKILREAKIQKDWRDGNTCNER